MKDRFNTKLDPDEEKQFKEFLKRLKDLRGEDPSHETDDYDLRGYWKEFKGRDELMQWAMGLGHGPDTYKKPNHPTFSRESIYHGAEKPEGGKFIGGSWDAEGNFTPPKMGKVLGYPVRDPNEGELQFFGNSPSTAGYAAPDGAIVLNPNSGLSPYEREAVARNEASRLWMRDNNFQPSFTVTEAQQRNLAGTAYGADPLAAQQTILSRLFTGDPSAGQATSEQMIWLQFLKSAMGKQE